MKYVRVSLTERGEPKGVKLKIRRRKNNLDAKQGLHVLRYDVHHLTSMITRVSLGRRQRIPMAGCHVAPWNLAVTDTTQHKD
jgi:hypothetical protein